MAPAASLALLLMLYLGLASALLGHLTPAYCWRRDSLSRLGQLGQRFALPCNSGVFLPIGVGCIWLAFQAGSAWQQGLSLSLAVGYVGAAIWPLRAHRHVANRWHYLAGAVQYLGAIVALFWAAWSDSAVMLLLALLAAIGIGASQLPKCRAYAGAWQRLAEASLFFGQYLLLA